MNADSLLSVCVDTESLLSMCVDIDICLLTAQKYNIICKYIQYSKMIWYTIVSIFKPSRSFAEYVPVVSRL